MKRFLANWLPLMLLAGFVGFRLYGRYAPQPPSKVAWVALADAPARAQATSLPILYDFGAVWCTPCRQMKREVFADDEAAAYINSHFVPVSIETPEDESAPVAQNEREAMQKFKVEGFPTLVVETPGKETRSYFGYGGKAKVLAFLKAGPK